MRKLGRSAALVMVVCTALIGCLLSAPTNATATAWHCGSQCNGRQPVWVVPSNGVQCANSEVLLDSTYPQSINHTPVLTDYGLVVDYWYSTVCETMWIAIRVGTVANRPSDIVQGYRTIAVTYQWLRYSLPTALGSRWVSPMFDDYCSTGCYAGYNSVQYNLHAVTYVTAESY